MKRRRQEGSSAIELVLTVAIFATVMSGLVGVLQSSTSSSLLFGIEGSLDEKARQVTEEIAVELRWAQAGTLLVTKENGSSRLDFRVPTAYVGGAVTWSPTITIKYAVSNLDANGDKIANEGSIVRIQGGRSRVLCDYVPSGGFNVTTSGSSCAIALDLRATDARRRVVRARANESVSTRN